MNSTLILYESKYGTTQKVAHILSLILGPSKLCNIEENVPDINIYKNVVIAFPLYEEKSGNNIIEFFKEHSYDFSKKRVCIVSVGLSKADGIKYGLRLKDIIKKDDIYYYFIKGQLEINKLDDEDKISLEVFCNKVKIPFINMGRFEYKNVINAGVKIKEYLDRPKNEAPIEVIKNEIERFIKENNTCSIATGYEDFLRSTPIEYKYFQGNIYIISEGGLKFVGILQNKNISVSIYENYTDMNSLNGLQISGEVELLDEHSSEYEKVIKLKRLEFGKFNKLPISINILKIKPSKFEFLSSKFEEMGYDVKQNLINA
ncbi:hypothetical protein EAI30_06915 [Romboutsia ilealis]|uniref:Pyridoxamine 5'-phosphate oxidase family protein n=1 Tax=Romboutsia faecis TaxID=2764597 RepID=A0ABR7JKG9_9FIRM|nr:flavodoxin domain-containing protein [Romboutsia faecis]MBC5995415.1 pyridoxamine 5'-phosphate oxidase family protein [Romboutsia faecis]MRN24343.1 hypothetical protein [Romboutsia ilealis]